MISTSSIKEPCRGLHWDDARPGVPNGLSVFSQSPGLFSFSSSSCLITSLLRFPLVLHNPESLCLLSSFFFSPPFSFPFHCSLVFSFPVFFTCYHSNEIVVFSPRREQNIVVLVETIVKNMKCVCETVTVISQIVI